MGLKRKRKGCDLMADRFDIEQVIRILGLEIRSNQADDGRDFDVACRIALEKLVKCKEYEDLEEQGLLLRLPCKVGDVIWDIDYGVPTAYEITGYSFGEADGYIDEPIITDGIVCYYSNSNGSITGSFAVSEIGKTVFLTKAESEQKLNEMESD